MNNLTNLIWDNLYRVAIPDVLTMSKQYLNTYGVYVTHDYEVDTMVSTNFVDVMLPISKIAEMYDDGFDLRIYARTDMLEIYRSIRKYILACSAIMGSSVNLTSLPYKDLIKLDKLAAYIYDKASLIELLNEDEKLPIMDARFDINSMFKRVDVNKDMNKNEYDSYANIFKSRMKKYGDRS